MANAMERLASIIKEKSLFLLLLLIPVFLLFRKIGDIPNDYYYEINGEEMHSLVLFDAVQRNISLNQAVKEYANKIWGVPYNGIDWAHKDITVCIDQPFNWPLTYDIFLIKNLISTHHVSTFIFQSLIAFISIILLYFIAKVAYNREVAVYTLLFISTSFGYLTYIRNGNISMLLNYMFVLIAYLVILITLKIKTNSKLFLYSTGIFMACILLAGYYSAWIYIQILGLFLFLIWLSSYLLKLTNKNVALTDIKVKVSICDILFIILFFFAFFFLYIYIHGKIFHATLREMIEHFLISFVHVANYVKNPPEWTRGIPLREAFFSEFIRNIFGARFSQGFDLPLQLLFGKPTMYIFAKVFFFIGILWLVLPKRLRQASNFLLILGIMVPFLLLLFWNHVFTMRRFLVPLMLMNIISGVGLYKTRVWICSYKKGRFKNIFIASIAILFMINFGRLYYDYFICYPVLSILQFKQKVYGYRQTAQYLRDNFDLSRSGIICENNQTVLPFSHRNSLTSILWKYRNSIVMFETGGGTVTAADLLTLAEKHFSDKARVIYIFEKDSKNIPLIYEINPDIRPLYYPGSLNVYIDDLILSRHNVASFKNDARAFVDNPAALRPEAAIDEKTDSYGPENGTTNIPINTPFIIEFSHPQEIGIIKFLLYDKDDRYYQYCVDALNINDEWVRVADRTKGENRSWQFITFDPLIVKQIRIIGTCNSHGPWLHIVEVEAYGRKFEDIVKP